MKSPATAGLLFAVAGALFILGGLLNGRSASVGVGAFFVVLGLSLRKRQRS